MKKLNIAILLLLFVGLFNLAAQDAEDTADDAAKDEMVKSDDMMKSHTITVKITPSAEARGVLNFEGKEQKAGNTIATSGDSEGRIKGEFDYNGIVGGVVEFEGDLKDAASDSATIGFGDNAYIYAHVLEAFGLIDKSVFDVYLQGGRFEASFDNAQYAGDDDWVGDVGVLSRDKRINMQLDLKIMDMFTIRTGLSFSPFDDAASDNDLGFALLFEKAFGDHKLIASFGYVVNSTNNIASYDSAPGNSVTQPSVPATAADAKDFDDFGFSLAYEGTFGQVVLMPFFNIHSKGVINKPDRLAYENGQTSWSAGVKFSYKDATNAYDLIGIGLDLDGVFNRENYTFYSDTRVLSTVPPIDPQNDMNMDLQGFQIKVWSDGLRSIMGDNYLKAWLKLRLETWVPDDFAPTLTGGNNVYEIERVSAFQEFGIGVEQYFVNKTNASVSLFAELTIENMAPFKRQTTGLDNYYSYDSDDGFAASEEDSVKAYLEFGLKASFTGVITADVK